ncbi:MAG: hypothetical protein JHC87_05555 [Thermoleophilaceae bacterium]|nr:hypothetical protein [Thermoleophilaceae bacterium]
MSPPATSAARVEHGQARRAAPERQQQSRPATRRAPGKKRLSAQVGQKTTRRQQNTERKQNAALRSSSQRPGLRDSQRPGLRDEGIARTGKQVVRAARPMLRVVAGGLDRLPAENVAGGIARGRSLILVAALLCVGLVYVSVGSLEAGDGFGRYSKRAIELQRQNTQLRARLAQLDSPERIQRLAVRNGMMMPVPEQFSFVRGRERDALKAVKTYGAPTTEPVASAPLAGAPGTQAGAAPQQAPATTPAAGTTPAPATGQTPAPATQTPAVNPQTTTPQGGAVSPAGGAKPATGGL